MMKHKKKWLTGVLAAVMLFTAVAVAPSAMVAPVSAAKVTQAQIDALKANANQLAAEKKELEKQLAAVAADKSKALQQKSLLEQQINLIQNEILNIDNQITQYTDLINVKTEELAVAEENERSQYALFCERVREMEEEGEVSYWSILFSSSSFADLLDRYMMIEEIIDYDNVVMNQLIAIREQIKADRRSLENARAEQEAIKVAREAAKEELKAREAEVNILLKQINEQEDQLEAAHKKLAAAASAMDAEIKRKQQQYAEQSKKIVSETGFIWPSYCTILTSLYGSRVHPVTGRANNHTGVDVASAGGTNILAAKSGVVITSAYNSSYGNYVVLDHGNGQTTLYAHMKKRLVSEGQTVKQGATLGLVGSTGSSTGNHLHFEIRINGVRRDPLNYFKGSTFTLRSGGKSVSYTVK